MDTVAYPFLLNQLTFCNNKLSILGGIPVYWILVLISHAFNSHNVGFVFTGGMSNQCLAFWCLLLQALWLHRRFLSSCWIKHFCRNSSSCITNSIDIERFLENEVDFCFSCSVIPDNEFEDYQAQSTYSATYIMWLVMVNVKFCVSLFTSDADKF